jgi:hypothetical protein
VSANRVRRAVDISPGQRILRRGVLLTRRRLG